MRWSRFATPARIPTEIRERIFDPFFTTKPASEGTGLGLSICNGILSALGGEIGVDSEIGAGSAFRVMLPPVAHRGAGASGAAAAPTAGRRAAGS